MPWLLRFEYPGGQAGPALLVDGERNERTKVRERAERDYKSFARKGGRMTSMEYVENDDGKATGGVR